MPNAHKNQKKCALPLHVHMTAMFVILVVLVCGVQIWITQSSLNKVLLNANENLFERIASETRSNMSYHFGPAFSIVDAYSAGELIRELDPSKRFAFVPELVSQLRANRHVFSLKAGFPDGEWLAVARVQDDNIRKKMRVGPNALFAAFNYSVVTQELVVKSYNNQLVLLETNVFKDLKLDPRKGDWFRSSVLTISQVSKPYYMPLLGRTGITLHRKATNGAVFGVDILLDQVSTVLQDSDESRDALRVLYDNNYNVYAYSQPELFQVRDALRQAIPLKLTDIAHPLIASTANVVEFGEQAKEITYKGEKWVVKIDRLKGTRDQLFNLAMAVKSDQLLKDANAVAQRSIAGSFFALLLVLPCIYYMSQWLAKPIRQASDKAKSIQHFKFNETTQEQTQVSEIKVMSESLSAMQLTIQRFLSLTNAMAKEDDLERMLALVCKETAEATLANSTYIYLISDDETLLEPKYINVKTQGEVDVSQASALPLNDPRLVEESYQFFQMKQPVYVPSEDVLPYITREKDTDNVLFIPLIDRHKNVIGGLGLGFDSANEHLVLEDNLEYIQTLAAYASVTIETQTMLAKQRELLDSFIQVMAEAIDTKSPYTGNHCQRVPILTEMLTKAAEKQTTGPFTAFTMTKAQWEELHIAAWLHDCGKVTTPEHVIDKSSKLETIYNRIHEIRMRFEILKRDAELSVYHSKPEFALSTEERAEVKRRKQQIDEDFALVAKVNVGEGYLDVGTRDKLATIAKQSWMATINPYLGLSWEERARYGTTVFTGEKAECILSDGAQHLIAWGKAPESEERFVLKAGKYQNNLGELYNLSTQKGTLNKEERYTINSHMIATVRMLERLPFPKHLKNVPLLAGSHHERMDGKGYPLGTVAEQLPVAARAMAIADVFEALTSQDRPYKQPKTLSETLAIMKHMAKGGHLDTQLFELFLTSNVYLDYAHQHISPQQMDVDDIQPYLITNTM